MGTDLSNVIDITQWDRARWRAVAFGLEPTIMVLVFEDADAGASIFRDLYRRFGPVDRFSEIRISIVEGDIPGRLPGYSVTVGPNLDGMTARAKAEGRSFDATAGASIIRVHRMNPPAESQNLNEFKKAVAVVPRYALLWGHVSATSGKVEISRDYALGKQDVAFRNVNDIGPLDIDSAAFAGDQSERVH